MMDYLHDTAMNVATFILFRSVTDSSYLINQSEVRCLLQVNTLFVPRFVSKTSVCFEQS